MLGTVLLIILILFLIGALPTWPYSSGWGYYPSGGFGLLLIILVILCEHAGDEHHAKSRCRATISKGCAYFATACPEECVSPPASMATEQRVIPLFLAADVDSSKAKWILRWKTRRAAESIVDAANSLIEKGLV